MLQYAIAIVGLGLLCSAWVLVQQWVANHDPEVRGPEDSANGCGACSEPCENQCEG